jgi:hypothetical protein
MVKISFKTKGWKLLATAVICVTVLTAATILLQTRQTAEAAMIEPIHEGLVGWWRFDEGEGNIAKDSSGNNNEGTIYGATWTDGKYGKALSFDGVDDYVLISNSPSLQVTGNLTISFWVYLNSLSSTQVVVSKMWHEYIVKIMANGAVYFEHQGSAGWECVANVLPPGSMTSGTWIHVAVVRDMSTMTVTGYKNGVANAPRSFTKTPAPTSYNVNIGRETDGYYKLNGILDEVRIYNRALSQTEINELSQKMPDFSSKLLAKIPKGTVQVIVTVAWQGVGGLNVTLIRSPSEIYTEDMLSVYYKTRYSTADGTSEMLNIKRLSISVPALSSDENWYITLDVDDVKEYTITVEMQK